jgi:hypothetical protein
MLKLPVNSVNVIFCRTAQVEHRIIMLHYYSHIHVLKCGGNLAEISALEGLNEVVLICG